MVYIWTILAVLRDPEVGDGRFGEQLVMRETSVAVDDLNLELANQ